ncbi:MAG: MFS transporter [bacterium]|nr:MFS transporter [bacterium]
MGLESDRHEMRGFVVVWLGQLFSLVGSGLTAFALGLWVVERCQAATPFALIALFTVLPAVALAPVAGVLADRCDRRRVMLLADSAACLVTLGVAGLLVTGSLEVWQVYVAAAAGGICTAFQQPAYLAATSQLVPQQQLGRAAGMVEIAQAASDILAPVLAGVLVVFIKVQGVVLIDLATFLFAVGTLVFVRFPEVQRRSVTEDASPDSCGTWLREAAAGWTYIIAHPGLVALLMFFAVSNFASGIIGALLVPMLLTIASVGLTGTAISLAGAGMLTGSLVMSLWGGPKRRIFGVLGFDLMKGLGIIIMGLRPSVWLVAAGAAWAHFSIPFVNASNQAIWQAKVPTEIQGRVFATRHMIARAAMPLAFLIAGPLADGLFEPLMANDSALAKSIELLIGSGTGRGMGLIFILMGGLIMLASVIGFLTPCIRQVEDTKGD